MECLNEIKDEKLRSLLKQYKEKPNPLMLMLILDYKDIKINKDRVDGFILKYKEFCDEGLIELGAIILCGILYKISFDIDSQTLAFYHDSGLEVE
jgi:hypothetical protein